MYCKGLKLLSVFAVLVVLLLSPEWVDGGSVQTRASPYNDYHPATLTVRVQYENSTPAVYASVTLVSLYNKDRTLSGHTKPDGSVVLIAGPLFWGRCAVNARDREGQEIGGVNVTLWPDDEKEVTIVLSPLPPMSNKLVGTVVNRINSTPISGALVSLSFSLPYEMIYSSMTTTSSDGRYSLPFPNTTSEISIKITHSHYYAYQYTFFWSPEKSIYILNPSLKPYSIPSAVPVEVVLKNSFTHETLIGELTLEGNAYVLDHAKISKSFQYNTTGEYYYITAWGGEYTIHFCRPYYMDRRWNVSYYGGYPLYLNETFSTTRVEVSLPVYDRMRHLYIRVTNSSGPVYDAHISWQWIWEEDLSPVYYFDAEGSASTNSSGVGHMGIPPGKEVRVSISESGHESKSIIIPPGDLYSDVYLNVTLKENEEPVKAFASVKVVDKKTGVPVPGAYVHANGVDENGRRISFYGWTGEDGYLNSSVLQGIYSWIRAEAPLGYGEVRNVTVSLNGTRSITIPLILWGEESERVEGVIETVDEAGRPVPGVKVMEFERSSFPVEDLSEVLILTIPGRMGSEGERTILAMFRFALMIAPARVMK